MDSEQYAPISTIARFNKVKSLTNSLELVVEVLRGMLFNPEHIYSELPCSWEFLLRCLLSNCDLKKISLFMCKSSATFPLSSAAMQSFKTCCKAILNKCARIVLHFSIEFLKLHVALHALFWSTAYNHTFWTRTVFLGGSWVIRYDKPLDQPALCLVHAATLSIQLYLQMYGEFQMEWQLPCLISCFLAIDELIWGSIYFYFN